MDKLCSNNDSDVFPDFATLSQIALAIPVSSIPAERACTQDAEKVYVSDVWNINTTIWTEQKLCSEIKSESCNGMNIRRCLLLGFIMFKYIYYVTSQKKKQEGYF